MGFSAEYLTDFFESGTEDEGELTFFFYTGENMALKRVSSILRSGSLTVEKKAFLLMRYVP